MTNMGSVGLSLARRVLTGAGTVLILCSCGGPAGSSATRAGADAAPADVASASDGAGLDVEAARAAVLDVLQRQQEAWNRGDIEVFMDGYVRGDRLRFTSAGSVRRGWQTTLDRYLTTYPDRAAMGHLTFSDLEVTVLSADYVEVAGRWQLQRESDAPGGRYTLLFERAAEAEEAVAGGGFLWRILHDHTSSDD